MSKFAPPTKEELKKFQQEFDAPEEFSDSSNNESSDIKDTLIGVGQGATLGFGDELLAGTQALADTAIGKSKLEDLYKRYRELQKQNEEGVREAHQRSPYLTGAGELAGGFLIPGGLAVKGLKGATTGARMLSAAKTGAVLGGLAGAGSSKSNIEDLKGLGADAATGAVIGGGLSAGMEGAFGLGRMAKDKLKGSIRNAIDDTPTLQNIENSFDLQKQGIKTSGIEGPQKIMDRRNAYIDTARKGFTDKMESTSLDFKQMMKEAVDSGHLAKVSPEMEDAMQIAFPVFGKHHSEFNKLLSGQANAQDTYNLYKSIRGINLDHYDQGTKEALLKFKDLLQNETKNIIGIDKFNAVNSKFRDTRAVVEPLFNSGETESSNIAKHLFELEPEKINLDLGKHFENLTKNIGNSNINAIDSRDTLQILTREMEKFNSKYPADGYNNGILEALKQAGKEHSVLREINGITARQKVGLGDLNPLKLSSYGEIIGDGATELAGTFGRIAGGHVPGIPAKAITNLAKAPEQMLRSHAMVLQKIPSLGWLGKALEDSLNSKSSAMKNAAIFSIMQNLEARKTLGLSVSDKDQTMNDEDLNNQNK